MKSIIVLGFGRSGTTWISDILSKVLGGLILFEPLHPSVTDLGTKFAYSDVEDGEDSMALKSYLDALLNGKHRKDWLLRNHVPVPVQDVSRSLLEEIWEQCAVIGFKEIRSNFMIPWFNDNFDCRIAYIVRDPRASIASIKRRRNFFMEFGWPDSYEMFLKRTIYADRYRDHEIARGIDFARTADTDVAKYAVMWSITHALVLEELRSLGLPIFHYEDFYLRPFTSVKMLLEYLGHDEVNIHPAHIFTPSMTTMKTLHGLYEQEQIIAENGFSMFWEDTLKEEEADLISDTVGFFGLSLYDDKGFPITQRATVDVGSN